MQTSFTRLAVLSFLLSTLASSSAVAETVSGRVTESARGARPIVGAQLTWTDARLGTQHVLTTAADGSYSGALAPGRYFLTISHPDYVASSSNFGTELVRPSVQHLRNASLRKPLAARDGSFQGVTSSYNPDGVTATFVAGVRLDFVSEDGSRFYSIASQAPGYYDRLNLPAGRYVVQAIKAGFNDPNMGIGFWVFLAGQAQTGSVFLSQCSGTACH